MFLFLFQWYRTRFGTGTVALAATAEFKFLLAVPKDTTFRGGPRRGQVLGFGVDWAAGW